MGFGVGLARLASVVVPLTLKELAIDRRERHSGVYRVAAKNKEKPFFPSSIIC